MKDPHAVVRVYSTEPALRKPIRFVHELFTDINGAWELSLALAKRDIKAMYRQSLLGYVWAFLPIIGTTLLFLFLRSGGAFRTGDGDIPYPVYVLVGTALWQLFLDGMNSPLRVMAMSRSMLVKINFPREAVLLAGAWVALFNFLVRLLVLIPALGFLAYRGLFSLSVQGILLFPIGVLLLLFTGFTFGILLTPVGMLYKDIQKGLTLIAQFWMFLSPVVVRIPDQGLLAKVMIMNPVSTPLDTARSWLVGVGPAYGDNLLILMPVMLCCFLLGWILFRVGIPHVISRLGM